MDIFRGNSEQKSDKMLKIKEEVIDIEEQFLDDRYIYKRDINEYNRSYTAIKVFNEIFEVKLDEKPKYEMPEIKKENIDIEEQFLDNKSIHEGHIFMDNIDNDHSYSGMKILDDNIEGKLDQIPELKQENIKFEEQFSDESYLRIFMANFENDHSYAVMKIFDENFEKQLVVTPEMNQDYSDVEDQFLDKSQLFMAKIQNENFEEELVDEKPTRRKGCLKSNLNHKVQDNHCGCNIFVNKKGTKGALKYHIECTHLDLKEFHCDLCEYKTTREKNLRLHKEINHFNPLKKYQCHLCDYVAYGNTSLELHITCVHLKLKIFKCDLCEYKTGKTGYLENHKESIHSFRCYLCDFVSHKKCLLKQHIDYVHKNKFQCPLCEYRATNNVHLNRHVKAHLQKFQCDVCEYKTTNKKYLERHKAVHLKKY